MARLLGASVAVLALSALAPAPPAGASVPVLVLDGTGYGHGVGLSQWGAEHLARTGRSTAEILGTFYPGASLAEATGVIRVAVHRAPAPVTTLTFPQGGELRSPLEGEQAPGFPVAVGPGGRVRVGFDGAYRVEPLVTGQATTAAVYSSEPCVLLIICPPPTQPPPSTTTPPPTTEPSPEPGAPAPGDPAAPPDGGSAPPSTGPATSGEPVWAVPAAGATVGVDERGRAYRGVVEATGGHALRLVNHVDVEDYLRGMAEVPGTWPPAAVQAQTIAARTYALRAMSGGGEICDDARCQVYSGAGAESPGQDAAVAATARQVLAFGGALAASVYSADAGGVSATTEEGFGTPDGVYPYLTTVHYETDNPLPWHREVALADVGARFRYPGSLTGVRMGRAGPSGRALDVVLEGSAGEVVVNGRQFGRSLGLRSTRFALSLSSAAAAPAPPPPEDASALQAMPDEASSMADRPMRPASELRLDRRPVAPAKALAADLPEALDPRRHPATVLAIALAAAVAGALGPVALVSSKRGVRAWGRWRSPRPRR